MSAFSERAFLRERQALLVHFNTPQSRHGTGFPADLLKALALKDARLSFSTILPQDRGPTQTALGSENAGGSVGIVVDIVDRDCVATVGSGDSGTLILPNGEPISGGEPPSAEACAASIDDRRTNNEWWVQNYIPVGIFVFLPADVFVSGDGDKPITFAEIRSIFPDQRFFTACNGSFLELQPGTDQWLPVSYDEIIPPAPEAPDS